MYKDSFKKYMYASQGVHQTGTLESEYTCIVTKLIFIY